MKKQPMKRTEYKYDCNAKQTNATIKRVAKEMKEVQESNKPSIRRVPRRG